MFAKKIVVSALMAAGTIGALAIPLPSTAANFEFFFNAAPRYEPVYHNSGRYYAPSRWDRDGDGIPNRRDPTPDGVGPRWDRDNDGIPNRRDPTPDGAIRFRDRDGDGVADRFDRYPNNPYYY